MTDPITASTSYLVDFSEITLADVAQVGGKNASLGELFRALKSKGVGVLDGFATRGVTSPCCWVCGMSPRTGLASRAHFRR
jgi:hypothetical protein